MADQVNVYRECTLGLSLADALESLLEDGDITEELGDEVFKEFDRTIMSVMSDKSLVPRSGIGTCNATLKGNIVRSNKCMDDWKMIIKPANVGVDGKVYKLPRIKASLSKLKT